MTRYEWMTMWESIDPTSVDRQRLIGIMCTCCTPDTAANIMQDWMMDAATAIAQARLERQEAASIAATAHNLALSARAEGDAAADLCRRPS